MHQTAYEACQDDLSSTRRDDYFQWLVELYKEHWARAAEAELAMDMARGVNTLTGQPLNKWFGLFWDAP